MTQVDDKQKEIEANLEFFLKELPNLKKRNAGKYVLLRKKEIIGIYDTVTDAQTTGIRFFDDEVFSIQKIDETPINLGYFSHAVHLAST